MRRAVLALLVALVVALVAARTAPAQTGTLPTLRGSQSPGADLRSLGGPNALERASLLESRNVELLNSGPVDPRTYILGPGDVLSLEITGPFSLSSEDLVSADGQVTFSQFGTFDVAGMTLAEAREQITAQGSGQVRGAQVRLVLDSMRAFKVYVLGEVEKPGAVRATAQMRVSEAVASSALLPRANLRDVTLISQDGSRRNVDLLPFLLTGDRTSNPTLLDGVTVLVSPVRETVRLHGALARPGPVAHVPGEDLATLLRLIGLAPSADSSAATIQRFDHNGEWTTLAVDLQAVLSGETLVRLEPWDRIYVQHRGDWSKDAAVRVLGAVARPGPVPVRRGELRVADVVELAGGALPEAVLERVAVGRPVQPDTVQVYDPTSARGFLESLTSYRFHESVVDLTQGPGPILAPGDVVSIPWSGGLVQLVGQVKVPGFYDWQAGWGPDDYIKAAGGWGKQADKGQARVTRGPHGQVVFAADTESIAPGDMIWVPEKRPGSFWLTVRDVTTLVISFATLYLLIDQARTN